MVVILELKTSQSTAIKIVVDAINSLLTDANFDFFPYNMENDNGEPIIGGMVVKEVNKTGKILVYMKLEADKFDIYKYNYHKKKYNPVFIMLSANQSINIPDYLTI
jgi:hypothetical protein